MWVINVSQMLQVDHVHVIYITTHDCRIARSVINDLGAALLFVRPVRLRAVRLHVGPGLVSVTLRHSPCWPTPS